MNKPSDKPFHEIKVGVVRVFGVCSMDQSSAAQSASNESFSSPFISNLCTYSSSGPASVRLTGALLTATDDEVRTQEKN